MKVSVWTLSLLSLLAVSSVVEAQPGGGRGGRGGGGMFGRGGIFSIATNEAVQKELGLSSDDAEKVKKVSEDFSAAVRSEGPGFQGFREMSQEEQAAAMAKIGEVQKANTEKYLPKLKEVLKPDQFTRLQQIHWQAAGTAAYSEPEVIKALALTTEQQDNIKKVNSSIDTKRREMFQGGFNDGFREKMEALNKERDTKVSEVLTKDQLDKFASLKGAKFDVEQLGGRGFGGRGPGGGGGNGAPRGKRPQPKAE